MNENLVFPQMADLKAFDFDPQGKGGWTCHTYRDYGVSLPFLLYLPYDYLENGNYPVMLHLNGDGSKGKTLAEAFATSETAAPKRLIADTNGKAIVLIPVTPEIWLTTPEEENVIRPRRGYCMADSTPNPYLLAADRLLQKITRAFAVDTDRIYLSGYSRGCMGSFYLLHKQSQNYSAAILATGASDKEAVSTWLDTPAWMFIAQNDDIIDPVEFVAIYQSAKEKGNSGIRLTVFEDGKHGIGSQIHKTAELTNWLLAQTKSKKAK